MANVIEPPLNLLIKSDYFDNHKKNKPEKPNNKHLDKDKTKTPRVKNKDYPKDERFMRFYNEYPRKVDPHDAYKAFKTIVGDDDLLLEQIISDIKQRKQHHEPWKDKKYIKYPAAYLRKGEYLSEVLNEKAELEEKRKLLNLENEKRMKAQEEASRRKEAQERENKNRLRKPRKSNHMPQRSHQGLKNMLGW
ncbi:TPA: hypothetical protein I8Z55_000385 [Legionella pneumophila]|nr:hypothetical protein [Legionella pneumophila]